MKVGDLVVLTHKEYTNMKAGTIGIIISSWGCLFNVTFPQGTWAFPANHLKPLTMETA